MSKEFSGKEACIAPEGVFIIGTYDENGVPNAMNAAWGSQSDFDEITLFLDKHKTTDNVKKTGAFTVAFATKDTMVLADYFGVETGNRVNKIEVAGCHVHESRHVKAPIIEEFPVTLECECKSYDDETGILVGKIVAQQADESVLTDGLVDYDKLQPIMYDSSTKTYRLIGPVVGKAFHDGLALKK
ncbi:flavin reductase family protein [Megasphaera massiliensis]|uniref:flavin reductase family protein n=1 Tax=Megasphaera massiliensis TaxID=1232428 RepID=UPI000426D9CA|nr:flavin reductase family protein [Megasphaera massiliensis]MBS6255883.1 flavin reductase family protein [Megasphaera sp.]